MLPGPGARRRIANSQWTIAKTRIAPDAAAIEAEMANGKWQMAEGKWPVARRVHAIFELGRFGAYDHLLFEVVVLFLARPRDAHPPKAGGEAARIETLSAVGIGREPDGAIHACR